MEAAQRPTSLYQIIYELLDEKLKNDKEALVIAKRLIRAYERGGATELRAEIRKLIKEVIENETEA